MRFFLLQFLRKDVVHTEDSVVLVRLSSSKSVSRSSAHEWVTCHTVTSLEPDFWLESIFANCFNHLQRYVWAVENTCVICVSTFVTYSDVVSRCIRINVYTYTTIQSTCKSVTSVINLKVGRHCRSVVQHTRGSKSSSNVRRTDNYVTLSTTSFFCNYVALTVNLYYKTFEFLCRPTSVSVRRQVKDTFSGNVGLKTTSLRLRVDSTDNLTVNLRKNLCRENVC